MIDNLILPGGYLALWGTALLLIHCSLLRLTEHAHCFAAERGWVKPPRKRLEPLPRRRDALFAGSALASGLAGILAFLTAASRAVPLPTWLTPLTLPPIAEVARICLAMCVFLFFITGVAEHPAYKVRWVAAWTAFAFLLVWIT